MKRENGNKVKPIIGMDKNLNAPIVHRITKPTIKLCVVKINSKKLHSTAKEKKGRDYKKGKGKARKIREKTMNTM